MKNYNDIVKKAWRDPEFKKRLLENPEKILKEEGIEVQGKIKVLEEKSNEHYFVLPTAPQDIESLSDDELEKAIGGASEPNGSHLLLGCPHSR